MGVSVKVSDTVYENVPGVYLPRTDGDGDAYFADTAWMAADGNIEIPGLKKLWFHIKKTDAIASNITGLSLPDCTEIGVEVYGGFTSLSMPKLEKISSASGSIKKSNCTKLYFPALKQASGNQSLGYHDKATKIVLPVFEEMGNTTFINCSNLTALVFGGNLMVSFKNNCLSGCTKMLDGESGFIYVKRDLLASYQADEGWSGYGVSFRAIEDYPEVLE